MKIRNVLIVGGGTAGWMTAAALLKLCPHIKTSLIESPDYPVSGVGESTLGQINEFFKLLDLKDEQWMAATGATYKVNIRFNDFYQKGETWDYPFGSAEKVLKEVPHGWMSWFSLNLTRPEKYHRGTFSECFNSVGALAKYNKLTDDETHWNPWVDSAYHFDALKFGQWLKENYCLPRGLEYHTGNVARFAQDARGYIEKLYTDDGREFEADLYIDCTGFKSLLLEQTCGSKFISYHHNDGGSLLNDTAVACHMPHVDPSTEITNSTNCTAIDNGWVWDVPLWERSGVGYVYSKDFAENPEQELYDYLVRTRGKERADKASMRTIPFKNGKHEKSWVKNVCAIGLSNCFVEPLEATGLVTTHEQITRLCTTLAGREGYTNRAEIDMMNLVADLEIDGFMTFISAHYAFSRREGKYWQTVADDISYNFTEGGLDNLFVKYSAEKHVSYEWIGDPAHNDGVRYIAAGMGFNPVCDHTLYLKRLMNNLSEDYDEFYLNEADRTFDEWRNRMYDWCKDMETSYEFTKRTIYEPYK